MTSSCSHDVKVLLRIETSREYGRGLLRGIYRYSSLHKCWQIVVSPCGPLSEDDEGPPPRRKTRGEELPGDVDGIIMRDHRGSPILLKRGIPVIFASYLHKDIRGGHRIVPDDEAIGPMAAQHLLERGFRRFAFVGYDGMYWSHQRHESFARTIANAGCECTAFTQARDLRLRAWRKERKVLAEWLRTLPRPVGLMACNDDRARQVVDACALAGLSVPEEVAVLGVDNDEFVCNLSNPSISSIVLNAEDAGYRAAELLDQLMKSKRPGAKSDSSRISSLAIRASPILVEPVTIRARRSTDISVVEDPIIARAVQFIRTKAGRSIRIADVVRAVPISRRSLFDRFRRVVGCTVHQYIKRARVARIEELLLDSSYSIGRIAEMLDFSSPEHIAVYFRSVRGVNPLAFRARHAQRKAGDN